jgi:uncharacterized protein YmfQ (DUF2313 family)
MPQTIVSGSGFTPLPGWPCNVSTLPGPPVDDLESQPTAQSLVPQLLPLTPRGAAWGTDEAGDGQGASPGQLAFWTAIAAWLASVLAALFDAFIQSFPSLATWSLDDWAVEYALPDACDESPTTAELQTMLRAKYAFVGAASPDYLICLAASLGYPILIEEYDPARIGCRIGDRLYGRLWGDAFAVHAPTATVVPARIGSHVGDRLASWGNSELECAIAAAKQPQTVAIFAYDAAGGGGFPLTLDDGDSGGDPLSA